MLDEVEFDRWHATALDALTNAEAQVKRGAYNWACFLAEQAARSSRSRRCCTGLVRAVGATT